MNNKDYNNKNLLQIIYFEQYNSKTGGACLFLSFFSTSNYVKDATCICFVFCHIYTRTCIFDILLNHLFVFLSRFCRTNKLESYFVKYVFRLHLLVDSSFGSRRSCCLFCFFIYMHCTFFLLYYVFCFLARIYKQQTSNHQSIYCFPFLVDFVSFF